jgi:hypothetical protein
LEYLEASQLKTVERPFAGGADFPGNWPQFMRVSDRLLWVPRVREVSPFLPAFIHHALTCVNEQTVDALGLTPRHAEQARAMRRAAVALMRRFEEPAGSPLAGAYGFWLRREDVAAYHKPVLSFVRGDWILRPVLRWYFVGPCWHGPRFGLNINQQMHDTIGLHADADDTAILYATFHDDARLDSGPILRPPIDALFIPWRDTGVAEMRVVQDWLPRPSGAFLTWFAPSMNDVDLVVNANVLCMLARDGRPDVPGAAQAIALINDVVQRRRQGVCHDRIGVYYPHGITAQYCLSRAYREGPVPALRPAVEILADEIERAAQQRPDGSVFWDYGQPHLDTAFAILVLLNAGRQTPLVASAVRYLVAQQDPKYGNWKEGYVWGGYADNGALSGWGSPALTTAIALEALCRWRIAESHAGAH